MAKLQLVDDSTFNSVVIDSTVPVLIDFSAPWCGPCKVLEPALEALADSYAQRALIVKVDVDASPALAARFGVRGVPYLLLMRNGSAVEAKVGSHPPAHVADMLNRWVQ